MMSFIEHAGEDLGGGRGPLHGHIRDVEVLSNKIDRLNILMDQ
jgi:hypothetical protein